MPTKKSAPKSSGKATKQGGKQPSNQNAKRKHRDPYAEATGRSLEDIVKAIEQPASPVVEGSPKLPTSGEDVKRTKVLASSEKPKGDKKKKQAPPKEPKQVNPPKSRQTPQKQGMTKAQRKEEQQRRRDAACKGRPINIPHNLTEEEEEEEHGGNHSNNEDYSDTQNERAKEYRKGGYHPVVVGDVYNDRYRVVKKLGWGYFSTVWLVWDYQTDTFQAMKVQKSAEHYREAAYDEIRLLTEIMTADTNRDRCCARMNDFFEHTGPNGTHVCMVFDVLGENLLSLIEWYEYRGIPLPIVKAIAQQVLIGLEHIHSINILHTDLKPENVLLSTPKHKFLSVMKYYKPPQLHVRPSLVSKDVKTMTKSQRRRYYQKLRKDPNSAGNDESDGEGDGQKGKENQATEGEEGGRPVDEWGVPLADTCSEPDPEWEVERFHHVALADFGNSCWTYRQFTDEVQTRQYRSPEVILGDGYSTPLDLWSAACMFYELITGEFLFDPKQGDNFSRDEDHLALMTELLGLLPEHMRCGNGKYRANYYTSNGQLRHIQKLNFWGLADVLRDKYHFTERKANEIAEFLLPMLELDPNKRASATDMLNNFQHFFEVQDDDYAPLCYSNDEAAEKGDEEHDGDAEGSDDGHRHDDYDHDECEASDVEEDSAPLASKRDEAELREWWKNHPLLNEASLASRGLTIKNVQRALAGEEMDTEEQQLAVEILLNDLEVLEMPEEEQEE